jgi:hypothetical protein
MRLSGLTALLIFAPILAGQQTTSPGPVYLHFSGNGEYVEIPSSRGFSVSGKGLTVSAWMRPDTLMFLRSEGSGYVHWMGKGSAGRQEWVFRMYNRTNAENPPRPNRISFYVFNPDGGLGVGSYFEDKVTPGEWIQVTGVADGERTYIYKNGKFRRCDQYQGTPLGACQGHPLTIHPQPGDAPLRLGTRDLRSFFRGGLACVRIWDRALNAAEIQNLYETGEAPKRGLVAEWKLNEGRGPIVHDSAHGWDGRIVGAEWSATRDAR